MSRHPFIKVMLINYLINNEELVGYEFIKYCRDIGILASSGTVYPHLKTLTENEIISFREEGVGGKRAAKACRESSN